MFKQGFSDISKADVTLNVNFLGLDLGFPMLAPTNPDLQHFMLHREIARHGGIGVIHLNNLENLAMYKVEEKPMPVMVVGTDIAELPAIKRAVEAGINMFLIEQLKPSMAMVHKLAAIKSQHPDVKVIVGNFQGTDSLKEFLDQSNAMGVKPDAIKVGLSSVIKDPIHDLGFEVDLEKEVADIYSKFANQYGFQIIAEGGIIDAKEMAKLLFAHASLVVMEEICAGAEESAKEIKSSMVGYVVNYTHKFFKTFQNIVSAIGPIRDEIDILKDDLKEILSIMGKKTFT